MAENSPTFQRWGRECRGAQVPKGRLKPCAIRQPSLRDLSDHGRWFPTLKRWAIIERPSGTKTCPGLAYFVGANPSGIGHDVRDPLPGPRGRVVGEEPLQVIQGLLRVMPRNRRRRSRQNEQTQTPDSGDGQDYRHGILVPHRGNQAVHRQIVAPGIVLNAAMASARAEGLSAHTVASRPANTTVA